MDDKKGLRVDMNRRKGKQVTQPWRAVSTQSMCSEGDGDKGELRSQMKHTQSGTSSGVSTAKCENINPEMSFKSRSLEGKLIPLEKHSISMEVGWSLMQFIKGGGTQKEIEESGVKITFPSSKNEDNIIIEGNSAESVTKASEKIQIIIDKAVNSPELDYSHFISLPLAIHPGLVEKLYNFQNKILGIVTPDKDQNLDSDTRTPASEFSSSKVRGLGIEKSIFIKPETFHLTVLMLKLWNKDRVKAAAEVLRSVSSRVLDALDNRPVSIRLKGLDCMKGSWTKARVLYAPVEEIGDAGRLLRSIQVIIDAFIEAGLVIERDVQHKLKLHATLMNVRHRKSKENTRKFDYFDARGIFGQYGSEEWGIYPICEAHLSQISLYNENGYYDCCASIPFPSNM